MTEAARELGVTRHVIRRLIEDGALPAGQPVPEALYQIRVSNLRTENVAKCPIWKNRPAPHILP